MEKDEKRTGWIIFSLEYALVPCLNGEKREERSRNADSIISPQGKSSGIPDNTTCLWSG